MSLPPIAQGNARPFFIHEPDPEDLASPGEEASGIGHDTSETEASVPSPSSPLPHFDTGEPPISLTDLSLQLLEEFMTEQDLWNNLQALASFVTFSRIAPNPGSQAWRTTYVLHATPFAPPLTTTCVEWFNQNTTLLRTEEALGMRETTQAIQAPPSLPISAIPFLREHLDEYQGTFPLYKFTAQHPCYVQRGADGILIDHRDLPSFERLLTIHNVQRKIMTTFYVHQASPDPQRTFLPTIFLQAMQQVTTIDKQIPPSVRFKAIHLIMELVRRGLLKNPSFKTLAS